jgi:hypothetical protein
MDAVTLGPRRRRRKMAQRLAELDRVDRTAALRLPAKPKQHRLGALVTLLIFALAVTGVVLLARRSGSHAATATSPALAGSNDGSGTASNALTPATADSPSSGVGEHLSRLLPAATAPAGKAGYTLIKNRSGATPRYDPCRAIHYVIREQNTPPGGDERIRQAVAAVSKATGLSFIEDATTTETPSLKRAAYLPDRYGDRWAPVMIAWTNPSEIAALSGSVAGYSGSTSYSAKPTDGWAYVSGSVFLDTPQLTALQAEPNGGVVEKVIIEHELGHLVGLGHVNDPTQIMNPTVEGLTEYRAGDLRGLAYEGRGSCHPEL